MNAIQRKIYDQVLADVLSGTLKVNDRVKTERELSEEFRTSRMNAHFAIRQLQEKGVLTRNKKQGTIVCRRPHAFLARELKSELSRKVLAMSHCSPESRKIHWNAQVISALEKRLALVGIELALRDVSGVRPEEYREALRQSALEGFNGLIVIPDNPNDAFMSNPLSPMAFHQKIFVFNRGVAPWPDCPYHMVSVNPFGEGVIASRYLIEKGHRRLVFLVGTLSEQYWAKEIARGLEIGLRQAGDETIKLEIWRDDEAKNARALTTIRAAAAPPALISPADSRAAKTLDYLSENGLTAGRDYALLSFDDNPEYRDRNLTTIAPPLDAIGETLAELVIDHIDPKTQNKTYCVKLESTLVVRATA